jgi:hypothetical protein
LAALLICSAGVAVLINLYGGVIWAELLFMHHRHQLATFVMPPESVAFDTNDRQPSRPLRGRAPLGAKGQSINGLIAPCRQYLPGELAAVEGTLFLHRLTRVGDGVSGIACVGVSGCDYQFQGKVDREVQLHITFCEPNRPSSHRFNGGTTATWYIDCPATDHLRFFAGQPDGSDLSHFTVRYELNGVPGVINGYLESTGILRLVLDRGRGKPSDYRHGWSFTPVTLSPGDE